MLDLHTLYVICLKEANKIPNYEYRCPECSAMVIFRKDFNDDTDPECIVCDKPMRKVFSATPAHFRGGGWGGSK